LIAQHIECVLPYMISANIVEWFGEARQLNSIVLHSQCRSQSLSLAVLMSETLQGEASLELLL